MSLPLIKQSPRIDSILKCALDSGYINKNHHVFFINIKEINLGQSYSFGYFNGKNQTIMPPSLTIIIGEDIGYFRYEDRTFLVYEPSKSEFFKKTEKRKRFTFIENSDYYEKPANGWQQFVYSKGKFTHSEYLIKIY